MQITDTERSGGIIRRKVRNPHLIADTVKGFRLFDRVRSAAAYASGRRTGGYFALRTLAGSRIHDSAKAAVPEMRKGYIQEREDRHVLAAL